MNKKIITGVVVLVVIGVIVGGYVVMKGKCSKPIPVPITPRSTAMLPITDALKFKAEYEALNSELNEEGQPAHKQLLIDGENNIVYLNYQDLLQFVDSGLGVLYFGRPGCPRCRDLVPTMLDFAKEKGIPIYYYNIEQDRTEHNEQYKHILSLFDAYLSIDTITQNEEDPDFDPTLKRVILPHLFFMETGEIKADLYAFQHEYLEYGEVENMRRLLIDKYSTIAGSSCAQNDC